MNNKTGIAENLTATIYDNTHDIYSMFIRFNSK